MNVICCPRAKRQYVEAFGSHSLGHPSLNQGDQRSHLATLERVQVGQTLHVSTGLQYEPA